MKTQVTVMGKTIEIELDNIIGSILTTKGDLKLDSSMKTQVMSVLTLTDTESQIIQSMLDSDNYESFSQFKPLTNVAVLETTVELIKQNGKTTSLEIRDALRKKGYWANC